MSEKTTNYHILLTKLNEFIRKYYKNRIIRGIILVSAFMFLSYLFVTFFEYFGHFSTVVRTILFYFYILGNLAILVFYIIIPLLKLYRIGPVLSYEEAAGIIGDHFPEVRDKLLNTLQLNEMASGSVQNSSFDLIKASIEQKTEELKPLPFSAAVNFMENRKYLKYALFPLAVLLIIMLTAPKILTESTRRLVEYRKFFERELPFHFVIMNDSLRVVKGQDFELLLKIEGESIPDKVYISYDGNSYLMNRANNNIYKFVLKSLKKSLDFNFIANTYSSHSYELKVLPRPVLTKFRVKIDYPPYIQKESSVFENTGDITIPAGSRLSWKFYTEDADHLILGFADSTLKMDKSGRNSFEFSKAFYKNDYYSINASNHFLVNPDSVRYYITVVPDAYPRIKVIQETDTLSKKFLFFTGEISDDYGFKKLVFVYKYSESKDSAKLNKTNITEIKFDPAKNYQGFFHSWDMKQIDIQPGDALEYYFEVWDNDEINGSKSAVSDRFYFHAPSLKEIDDLSDKLANNLKNSLYEAEKKAKDIQKDIAKAQKDMIENKDLKWENKKFIEKILEKQDKLKEDLKEIKDKYIENVMNQDDNKKMNEELLKKYEQLYKLFDEVMPEDMKKLYNELQEMLEKNMKDKIPENMDKMNLNNKEAEKELDRMLEMFKKMEVSQKAENIKDKLDDLSKRQEELSNKSDEKKPDKEDIKAKQDEINKDFEDVKKDFEELNKLNKELENPMKLDDLKPEENEIQQDLNNSMENLKEGKMSKASKSQKGASGKMKKLSEKLSEMMMESEMETKEIDAQKLRQILENVLYVSFEQEKLLNDFASLNSYNPQYVEEVQKQNRLKEFSRMIEDSLFALSKEVPAISSIVNKEIGDINFNYGKLIGLLSGRNIPDARVKQQYILTATNNLALLLTEILKNMQQEMNQMQNSGKMSKKNGKPKKKGNSIGDLKKMQDEMTKKLEEMKKGMNQGNKPGMKPGEQNPEQSREFAKIAQQQEMLRNALQKAMEEQNKKGNSPVLEELNKIQELMKKTQEELVNKKLTDETINRQKEITVKLLEAEKAELKQDYDDKRESKTARDIFNPTPPSLEQYKRMKLKEVELLQTVPPALNDFYRQKVKDYFNKIQ